MRERGGGGVNRGVRSWSNSWGKGKGKQIQELGRDGAGSRTVGRGVRAEGEIQDDRREVRNGREGKFDATVCTR